MTTTARDWLREHGYEDVAELIDRVMAEIEASGSKQRRNWWDVLAGVKRWPAEHRQRTRVSGSSCRADSSGETDHAEGVEPQPTRAAAGRHRHGSLAEKATTVESSQDRTQETDAIERESELASHTISLPAGRLRGTLEQSTSRVFG